MSVTFDMVYRTKHSSRSSHTNLKIHFKLYVLQLARRYHFWKKFVKIMKLGERNTSEHNVAVISIL